MTGVLDPAARVSEILFGVIMALTFTSTIDAASGGLEELRTLLYAAVGCNVAWGIVDAVMYLMGVLAERGRDVQMLHAVRAAATPGDAHRVIADALVPAVASVMTDDDLERFRQGVLRIEEPPPVSLTRQDWRGALGVFLLVFLSTLPIVVPFVIVANAQTALRTSNVVAVLMLFGCGYTIARYGGYRPLRTGLSMVAVGVVLVAITVALGG